MVEALDALELDVDKADELLRTAHLTSVQEVAVASAWRPPHGLGPLPASLEVRARTILGRQLETARRIGEAVVVSRRQLAATRALSFATHRVCRLLRRRSLTDRSRDCDSSSRTSIESSRRANPYRRVGARSMGRVSTDRSRIGPRIGRPTRASRTRGVQFPMAQNKQPTVSAVLIVKDEEDVLEASLESVQWCDEIVVYDTGSTDGTLDIARRLATTVVEGYWDADFGAARNRALEHATGEWVLTIDADEVLDADPVSLRRHIGWGGAKRHIVEVRDIGSTQAERDHAVDPGLRAPDAPLGRRPA